MEYKGKYLKPGSGNQKSDPTIPGIVSGNLETFDLSVFRSDNKEEQCVCDFVLTLALVFNDIKNVMWARGELKKLTDGKQYRISTVWGECSGFDWYTWRLLSGIFHEALRAVQENEHLFNHPLWEKLMDKCPKAAREWWKDIRELAKAKIKGPNVKHSLERYRRRF